MNEEEKNITPITEAPAAPAPKKRGRPRKNPLPAENNELPLQEKAAEPKEKKAAKTVESKTEAPAAAEPNEPVSLIEKVRKYVRKPKKTETPAPAGQTENIAETPKTAEAAAPASEVIQTAQANQVAPTAEVPVENADNTPAENNNKQSSAL